MLAPPGVELAALIGAYSAGPDAPVAVAVSGGSDSTALLHLAANWAQETQRKLHILTVNHGLRPAAADEAAQVAQAARKLGLGHDVLTWKHPKPGQAAARDARHRLLAGAARTLGARVFSHQHGLDNIIARMAGRAQTDIAAPAFADAPGRSARRAGPGRHWLER